MTEPIDLGNDPDGDLENADYPPFPSGATDTVPSPRAPTPALARALCAQVGDVVNWGNPPAPAAPGYRWDGDRWNPLQVGDVCRNARDGSAMIWGGAAGWRKPRTDNAAVDELAAVLWPGFTVAVDDQPNVDWYRALAQRAITHGYIHTLRAPDLSPAAYHFPRIPAQVGDPVDITWTNGRTTHHTIEAVNPDGGLTLRNRA